ncbi:MAG: 4Fe-4S binding protein [Bacillota bacterium]
MCDLCIKHAKRDERWYYNYENYLFQKIFPEPEQQEIAKQSLISTFAETEWRYSEEQYVRNPDFLRERANSGLGGQIITKEEMLKVLALAAKAAEAEDTLVVVGHCPCRLVYDGTRDYVCIGFGMPVAMSMEIAYGRLPKVGLTEFGGAHWSELRRELRKGAKVPLTLEEAKQLTDEWEKKGLWHLIMGRGRLPLIEAICNCERPYCTYWRYRDVYGVKDYCLKGHYVAVVDTTKCTGCGACMTKCQFGATSFSQLSKIANIDPKKCFGCGLCRVVCKHDAISMVDRELVPAAKGLW